MAESDRASLSDRRQVQRDWEAEVEAAGGGDQAAGGGGEDLDAGGGEQAGDDEPETRVVQCQDPGGLGQTGPALHDKVRTRIW